MSSEDTLVQNIKLSLNKRQQEIFEACIHGSDSIFCTGQGGTGKSWLLECVVRYFRETPLPNKKFVAVTASTGIAAFLIKGITLHRFAGTGIEETDLGAMIGRASRGMSKTYWINTSILIIDEVSMISATFFENLSLLAKALRSSNAPFGGIRILMFGDFLQLPPVSKIDHDSTRIFHTDAWTELNPQVMELKEIMRQTDPTFTKVLSEIRYGICSNETEKYIRELDREVSYDDGIEPVRLFAKRNTTEAYNASMLNLLTTPSITYKSIDSGDIGSLRQCPAPQILNLKEGCQVMVIRNMSDGVVNGSVGTVVGFETSPSRFLKKPVVKLTMPDGTSSMVTIGRVTWETIAPNGKILASRVQFPLILAWAVTIHKSQGQTLPRLCVDMSGIFETGQAYVAISRCSNPINLRIQNFNKKLVMAASSCVEFYQKLDTDKADVHPSEEDATGVAQITEEGWDNITVSQSPHQEVQHPQGDVTEAEIMLGSLSLQENSTSSRLDSEN